MKDKNNIEERPYENEHACRIHAPSKYDKFARSNCKVKSGGKCVDVIFGIKDNKSEIQAYRYKKSIWSASSAKSHCNSHNGSFEAAKKEYKETNNMGEKVTKTFKAKIKGIDEKNFTVDALISDQTLDRYGDIILLSAWKKGLKSYKEHPVLLSSHNYRGLTNQIGELSRVRVTEEGLESKIKYYVGEGNAEADWAFNLAKKGMAAFSVGFIPHKAIRAWSTDEDELKEILEQNGIKLKKDQKLHTLYSEVELLENSQVTVPANPSALQKSFDEEKDGAIREFIGEIKDMDEEEVKSYTKAYDYIEEALKKKCDCDEDCGDEVIEKMSELLVCDNQEESKYKELLEEYNKLGLEAPEFKIYKTVEDVLEGSKDLKTSTLIIDKIYEKKTSELFNDILNNLSIENKVEDNFDTIVEKISEKVSENVCKKVKEESDISTDVLIHVISDATEFKKDSDKKKDDKSETYIKEILDSTSFLKK